MSALDARVNPVHDGFIPLSNANTKPRPRGRVSPAPNFLPSFSKSSVFLSKLFQTFLWWFCGISRGYKVSKPKCPLSKLFAFLPSAGTPATPRGRRAAKSVRIVEVDMKAPYHRFRFTERKIADCPPRPQLPISADEHRESQIVELQDTPEFTFFSPCHRAPPSRQLGIGGDRSFRNDLLVRHRLREWLVSTPTGQTTGRSR